jgi:hypothetical protein
MKGADGREPTSRPSVHVSPYSVPFYPALGAIEPGALGRGESRVLLDAAIPDQSFVRKRQGRASDRQDGCKRNNSLGKI